MIYNILQYNTVQPMIIVGGIGDAGNRGVWSMLEQMGIYMGSPEVTITNTKDSKLFMHNYSMPLSENK